MNIIPGSNDEEHGSCGEIERLISSNEEADYQTSLIRVGFKVMAVKWVAVSTVLSDSWSMWYISVGDGLVNELT